MNPIKKFNDWRVKQDGYMLAQKWERFARRWIAPIIVVIFSFFFLKVLIWFYELIGWL